MFSEGLSPILPANRTYEADSHFLVSQFRSWELLGFEYSLSPSDLMLQFDARSAV
jgi:hypothetical protein